MLKVSNVHKAYGLYPVLKDVSFVVNPGERVGLIGPNGCGKTTLFRIIAGREQPDRGSVRFQPPDLRPGYLEKGLVHGPDDTVGDLLHVGDAALEDAEAGAARRAGRAGGAL